MTLIKTRTRDASDENVVESAANDELAKTNPNDGNVSTRKATTYIIARKKPYEKQSQPS